MTPPQSLSLLLLALVFMLNGCSSAVEDEIRSLLEFKKGIKNDPLGKIFSSWIPSPSDLSACPSSFYGVECDANSNSVASITLDGLGLVGDLKFSTLNGLKQLKVLSLSGNSFTGRIVPALGTLVTLQHLDLSGNLFYGPIPARINELWGLNYLNLSNNNFNGGYPSGIGNLQQLRVLDLHNNVLWGDVGELFLELKYIEHLDLSNNSFFGSLPMNPENGSFGSTIHVMNLSHNNLDGGFFPGKLLQTFGNLQVLDLGYNGLTGELPSFMFLYNLRVLRLGNNQLYGLIPEELLQGMGPLEELDLSGNGFSGSIPEVNSTKLRVLNISSNHLLGSLPSSVGNCAVVDLSKNVLHDDISVIESWETNLEIIDLSSNRLTGNIPNIIAQFQQLTSINFGNNSLEGMLPSALGTSPRLVKLDLSTNKLGGPIPTTYFTSTTLMNLNVSGNRLSGSIPLEGSHASELLVQSPYQVALESLDLSENTLTGNLSSAIGNLRRLHVLNLAKNQLSGMLPTELAELRNLEFLDVSNNNFSGRIPEKLSLNLRVFDVSNNDLSGAIPDNLKNFNESSFRPGNSGLVIPEDWSHHNPGDHDQNSQHHHNSKSSIRVAIILASVGAALMIGVVLLAYHRERFQDIRLPSGFKGQSGGSDVKLGRFSRPAIFKFHGSSEPPPTSLSFSNDHLLTANSRSLSGQIESGTEIVEHVSPEGVTAVSASTHLGAVGNHPAPSGRRSSPGSPMASSPRFIDTIEQPVTMDVYSPDRLAGELFFLDGSLPFTAEELSRAPAEVLGRSSHGTLYKATLNNGCVLTVKWLRVGLVKNKKEFAKEVKKIGSIRNPNAVPLRAYYWGPREQERLILADYIPGDSLALHLYETTPRRYSPLSFNQRLKVAVEVARGLGYLHERGLPHGNLKPTNIILVGADYSALLTDYGLHRLMTSAGIAEQILNLGALGYRAPELATATKPIPSFKADVYALGVILMELLTRRSAGDIISGQSGAVDLTDWVRLCDQEGRGMDCIDRDIAGGEEHCRAMDDLLTVSLRCILPVNERPNIRQVVEDLCSISV
ncbi:putative inactive receptor kinase [Capsicum annuum]|uniref:Inactive receptor kinase n=1 Tax=Capsicum annuum TaxID=4072 RepID=A0A1U8EVD0_CAPAN|nr:probable inactive receptor kinase At5g10020 [Capsicum annuum]KAF3662967.1 putative inactive receptor kinase [Capsicum annuum]KAF3674981.1 putative inactive receptor kinase [Capsicum annuum]PHT65678.1 putative inactive receptor kinase [Capsicum annuum]